MADRRRPGEDAPPPVNRLGDWSLAFAAAFALHVAILVPFLMHLETQRPVKPGAAAVMVNIVHADSGTKPEKPEPKAPKAEKPAAGPPEKLVSSRPASVTDAPKKASAPGHAPSVSSAPAQPRPSMSQGKPGGVAAAGASEAGVGNATAKASYLDKLESWLAAHKRYPRAAKRLRIEGVAILRFTLARDGGVISYRIEQSSGSEILDREVEATLQRSEPLPPPPSTLTGDELEFRFPIRFRLDE